MTEDQNYCEEMLALWCGGHHHLPKVYPFGSGICINFRGDLSTYDFARLTHLVLLAHKKAVRIEIASSGPGMVKIIAHRRKHDETLGVSQRHPSLFDLVETINKLEAL